MNNKLPNDIRVANRKASYKRYREKYPDRVAAAQKKYRKNNRAKIAALTLKARERQREQRDRTKNVPCADCGQSFPAVCMDFDHREGEEKHPRLTHKNSGYKKMPIAVGSLSGKAFLEEIKKCDVVCANCHRIRTWERKTGNKI